jgi:tetratricopeptide (TPR) repeat protein
MPREKVVLSDCGRSFREARFTLLPVTASQPVFLSYASQDAEVAYRIAEAMREAGLKVWFDQSELRGGDAWDQKIRRQIKECVLFVPIVSANTDARAEGYFRLEWKLAVDRSHLMADDAPFLFPVAIDATSERVARVPDRFREVQWMRLEKDSPEAIARRAAKVLAGEAKQATRAAEPGRRRFRRGVVWPLFGIAMAIFFITKPYWSGKRDASSTRPGTNSSALASDPVSLAKRAVDISKKLSFTREDLAVAADLSHRATELDPTLALGWSARARVEAAWVVRFWDTSDARRKAAHDFAKRALALDPDEPSALWVHGRTLGYQRSNAEGAAVLERALKASPDDNHVRRDLAATYARLGRQDEGAAMLQEAIRRDPGDPINYTTLAATLVNVYELKDRDPTNVDRALGHLDRAIAIRPTGSALAWKAANLAAWKGDLDGALAALDQLSALPYQESTEERLIYMQMWVPLLARQPDRALAAAARTTSTYFTDQVVSGPIGWMKAFAHRQAGRANAATEELRAAEVVMRERLAVNPNSLPTQADLAITLALLDRKDEAARQFARFDAAMRDQNQPGTWSHVRFHAAMGDAKRTVAALKEARKPMPIWFTDVAVVRDPWFDRVRGQPEFKVLLAEIAAKK